MMRMTSQGNILCLREKRIRNTLLRHICEEVFSPVWSSVQQMDENYADTVGRRSIFDAAAMGSVRWVQHHLTSGEDPNTQCAGGMTPLALACDTSHGVDLVRALLADARVDPNIADVYGKTPLMYACDFPFIPDSDFRNRDGLLYHRKCLHASAAIVRMLLNDDRVDTELSDEEGNKALDFVENCANPILIRMFLSRRAR